MKVFRTGTLCLLVAFPFALSAFGGYIVTTVSLSQQDYSPYLMTSGGSAVYYNYFGDQSAADLSGIHAIRGDNNSTPAAETISGSNGQWAGTLGGISGTAGVCYRARVDASGGGATQGAGSGQVCYAPPPPPPPPPGGGSGGSSDIDPGGGGTNNEDIPCFPGDAGCPYSPIIINFGGGGYRLTGSNAPVSFDMSGNGHPMLMGWTAAGADEAFLWLDRNHNGRVTSGAELFGNFTPLQNGELATNGFEALAEYDANRDGVIDSRDPIWPQLLLWRDLNHNGISEPSEISRLDASDVTGIDLQDHWTGRRDSWGNVFRYKSLISVRNDAGDGERKEPVYDIFFVPVAKQ
jgi:hypothetical protein